jgi:hypothetical protein
MKMLKLPKILTLLVLFSCSTTIKDFDKYQKSPLLQTEFMPNPDLIYTKLPSVVIFPFQTTNRNAQTIGATSITESEIVSILTTNRLATVQDRKNLKKLEEEIKLSEVQSGKNSVLNSANYAIDGEVSSITFSSKYRHDTDSEAYGLSKSEGYEYTAFAQGYLKIIEIPSLSTVETILFSATVVDFQESKGTNLSLGKFNFSGKDKPKEFDENLARMAIKKAIQSNAYKLKTAFAKTGYIMEKRILKDKVIFLVSLGSRDGIKQEDKVEILQKYEDLNVLTGKREILQRKIAVGTVADKTEESKTWIVVPNEKAHLIKLGDPVKLIYAR